MFSATSFHMAKLALRTTSNEKSSLAGRLYITFYMIIMAVRNKLNGVVSPNKVATKSVVS